MSDMDPLYQLMQSSAQDMSEASVEMKEMMTADEKTDVDIKGYGPTPSFAKQLWNASDRTFFASAGDPDGTIAGLAAVGEGQWFRVAVQDGANVVIAFNNYRKVSGEAVFINSEPNTGFVNAVRDLVLKEINDRTKLIHTTGIPAVLSILDDNGYEAGRVTMSSVELEKFKMRYSASGPVLSMQDQNGYGVQLLTPDGKLMAGLTKLFDGPGLLSVFGDNGFGSVLLDEKGRVHVGANILSEISGYALRIMDDNGWVIWAVTDQGYTISRDGGGNVEPVPSVLETSAVGHWLFGREATSYNSRVGSKKLIPQEKPSFNENHITTLPWGGALVSDIPDAGEYTVCAVVRVPAQTPQSDCVVVYGTQNGYSLRDNDDTYTGNQLSLFSDRDTRRWIRSKISGYRGTSRQYPTMQPPISEWIFVSHVVRLTGAGKRYQAIVVGDGYFQELREADMDRLILSGRNIAVGNAYCDVAMFKTKGLDIAEFIYFDHALSAADVKNVYINSRIRMAERSINLQ